MSENRILSGEIATCSTRLCGRPAKTRGMCNGCYLRWLRATSRAERPGITRLERFWAKVEKSGPIPEHAPQLGQCWEWMGTRRPSGHGIFGGRSAHVVALQMATGEQCPPGQEGCHRCDNPQCVRPSHIYYGTRQDNSDDAWARERHQIGSERPAARLIEEQVEQIRVRYAGGESGKALAVEFGMKPCSIYQITSGLKWRHAAGPITRKRAA